MPLAPCYCSPLTMDARHEVPALGRVGVFSAGIARIPHLKALLGADEIVFRPGRLRRVDAVVGWGRKPNTVPARRYAAAQGVPFVALEDGLLRSVGLGVSGDPPLSIVVDPVGIYYDATRPSLLEQILEDEDLEEAELARAQACMDRVRAARLSKYNHAPVRFLGHEERERVLVVDQTAGDWSIRLGLPTRGGFSAMLEAAAREHPDAEILVKTHPDVTHGAKRGHLNEPGDAARLRLLTEPCNPMALLEQVDRVYVMTSLLGFEALVRGLPVTCFGAPFYAGWGLTDDRARVPSRRTRRRSVRELFAAAYLRYARYVDPETGRRCGAERVIEHLALQREVGERNARAMVCVGFSAWKRAFVPSFVAGPGNRALFAKDARRAEALLREHAPADGTSGGSGDGASGEPGDGASGESGDGASGESGDGASGETGDGASGESGDGASGESGDGASGESGDGASGESAEGMSGESAAERSAGSTRSFEAPEAALLVWGTREGEDLRALAGSRQVPLWRMEDGFLRSVGLGSDLYAPASLVVDPLGIYYDPTRPSELERILLTARFSPEELERARRLRERIVDSGVSKYNVGVRRRVGPRRADARAVVLVVGQVEDDASIRLGCVDIRRNEELLRAARVARPDAHLIYKPHPDVVSENRRDSLPLVVARRLCDEVVTDASLADCLAAADEVHTLTSLVGFEALLRGLSVVTHGLPFYAGWGLTEDRHACARRDRRLSLDELVAGALLRYPRYVHPVTRRYTSPEAIVDLLEANRRSARGRWEGSWAARQLRKLRNLGLEVLRAP